MNANAHTLGYVSNAEDGDWASFKAGTNVMPMMMGRYMVVSGEKSETISSYRIEPSGLLLHLGKYSTGKGSNWVKIVSFD